jgi:hypothetical protein
MIHTARLSSVRCTNKGDLRPLGTDVIKVAYVHSGRRSRHRARISIKNAKRANLDISTYVWFRGSRA